MNKVVVAGLAAGIVVLGLVLAPVSIEDFAQAKHFKRLVVSGTLQSEPHRATGHESHQAIEVLPPMENAVYKGTISYTADKSVDLLVYHRVTGEVMGQTIHEMGGVRFAVEKVASGASGNARFVGDAVLFHTGASEPYSVTVTKAAQVRAMKGELSSMMHKPGMMPAIEKLYNADLNPRQIGYPAIVGFNDLHIEAIRHLKPDGDPEKLQVIVHHHCKLYDDMTAACLLFSTGMEDQDKPYGIEYVITAEHFAELPEEEKQYWHYHKTEFPRAEAAFPDMSESELAKVKPVLDETYGKVFYFWQVGDKYPMGEPEVLVIQNLPAGP